MLYPGNIARAALQIRRARNHVDTGYALQRLSRVEQLHDPREAQFASSRALNLADIGTRVESLVTHGVDLDFNTPGTTADGTPSYIRKS